jgi:hypothetical protein
MFGDLVVKPQLEAACMWNTRWVENIIHHQGLYDAFDSNGSQNATALALEAWGSNLLSEMVEATHDGSVVKSYASYDDGGKLLNIFLLNKDYTAQQVDLTIKNYVDDFKGSIWQLHGASVSDKFPEFAKTDSIFEPSDIAHLTLAANSVTILKLQPDNVALPVTLKSFSADKRANGIQLNWTTSSEKNILEYVVERSSDGEIYLSIGSVAATNEDSSVYNFDDSNIANSPVLYYRLVVVEGNGNKVSSRVVSVTVNSQIQKVMVHPNPFDNSLVLRISSDAEKKINISLIDILGRTVIAQQKLLYKGNNSIELTNLNRLMKGLYLVKIGDGSYSNTLKVVKR